MHCDCALISYFVAGFSHRAIRRLLLNLAAVAALCVTSFHVTAQNFERPWEDPNGPACFDLYFSTATTKLNAYNGSPAFNDLKPYGFSPWGHMLSRAVIDTRQPDDWHQHGGNRNQYIWESTTLNVSTRSGRWGNLDWDTAQIPLMRPFVLDCIRRAASSTGTPGPSGASGGTSGGSAAAAGGGLDGTLTITMRDGRVIALNASDIISMVYRRGASAGGSTTGTGGTPSTGFPPSTKPTASSTGTSSPSSGTSSPPDSSSSRTGTGASSGPDPAAKTTAVTPAGPRVDGNTRAFDKRGRNGERFTYNCPTGFELRSVWGSDIYTDDSSICTAAVHVGLIASNRGGTVTIEIRPGRASYLGSTRNGVTTLNYGGTPGSFVFIDSAGKPTFTGTARPAGEAIDWSYAPLNLRGRIGQQFNFYCPAGGKPYPGYGSSIYTDDSNVCTAAVHAGVIKADIGGNVTIEIRPGQASYQGTTRNGITTRSYGRTPGSFVIVGGGV